MPVLPSALATEREMLKHALEEALRDIPGAVSLHMFGSDTRGSADGYSDIDMQVLTTNLELSLPARHHVINRVAAISLEWTIHHSESAWASTILLDSASPYHKLDIGFSHIDGDVEAGVLEHSTLLWKQTPHTRGSDGISIPTYEPPPGTAEHIVLGELLSLTRYVKARKRECDFTCWRFASSLAHAFLSLLYTLHVSPNNSVHTRLSTTEFLALDSSVPEHIRTEILNTINFSDPVQMDQTVYHLSLRLVELLEKRPEGSPIPVELTDRLFTFVDEELSTSAEPNNSTVEKSFSA